MKLTDTVRGNIMSMATLEKAVLEELRKVTGNNKLRKKDIMEWSTGEVKSQADEDLAHLPELGVNVAYKRGK